MILEKIFFKENDDAVLKKSTKVLNFIGNIMLDVPEGEEIFIDLGEVAKKMVQLKQKTTQNVS